MPVKDIDSYLAEIAPKQRATLEKLRGQIKRACPDAVEVISYDIPALKYQGRILLYFAAFKNHSSLYPATQGVMAKCGEELASRRSGKGTIRFTDDDPLPAALVRKITKIRMAEIEAKTGRG
jgi:uncharacterized protein YdhG (YjbR/CyaY superfamily)